jgi:hypothetical protein
MSCHTWALEKLLDKNYFIPKLPILCAQISARCITCAQNNASQGPKPSPGINAMGTIPFEDLEEDPVPPGPCLHLEWLRLTPPTQKRHER